jgi:two-component system, chemotaxis family, chemotaxis protein CheY
MGRDAACMALAPTGIGMEGEPRIRGEFDEDTVETPRHAVLIVDDEPDIRDAVAQVVAARGYEVWTAENGLSALYRMLRSPHPPCLVLIDLWMPVMDGFTLVGRMRQNPALVDVPVVLMSACDLTRNLHMLPILEKPFAAADLLKHLDKLEVTCTRCTRSASSALSA